MSILVDLHVSMLENGDLFFAYLHRRQVRRYALTTKQLFHTEWHLISTQCHTTLTGLPRLIQVQHS